MMDASSYADSLKEVEKIEIFIACRKLKNMDVLSKSDPIVRCYTEKNGKYDFYGETEMIKDNLNPNFSKSFIMDYHFEMKQRLRFEILDYDGPGKYDYIGEVLTSLNELVGAKNQTSIFDVKDKKQEKNGKLILRCEQVRESNEILTLEIGGDNLHKTGGLFGSTNPALRFFRSREDGAWVLVYQTEVVKKNRSPVWKEFSVTAQKLANGDHYRPIKVECISIDGKDDVVIGEATFSIEDLIEAGKRSFTLKSVKFKTPGQIAFRKVKLVAKNTFLDYIRGGTQLAVACAIDFTGSNGIPSAPTSLHAMKIDGSFNEYQKAIMGVCDILLAYDFDKMIPVFGFGGKPNFPTLRSNQTSHCFPCTGIPDNATAYGLQGIMESYMHTLKHVELSGPTLFAPLITQTMKIAQENKQNGSNEYIILLILTDGEIHDMENTINCLIQSAKLPLSIIIVGIGAEDFTKMEILDGDEGLYNSNGVKAERDLVQFVPFRKFSGNHEALAREVLAEVPTQLVEYMEFVGKKPEPPKVIDINKAYNRMGTMPEGPMDYKKGGTVITDDVAQQYNFNPTVMAMGQNLVGQKLQSFGINPNQQGMNYQQQPSFPQAGYQQQNSYQKQPSYPQQQQGYPQQPNYQQQNFQNEPSPKQEWNIPIDGNQARNPINASQQHVTLNSFSNLGPKF